MIEKHPRLDIGNLKIIERKIILGSFPVWSLVKIENIERLETNSDVLLNLKKGEFPFFFGSSTNKLWKWYKEYVDPDIIFMDVENIKESLSRHKIGITDVILSCKRKNRSALDKDLSQRVYNYNFFTYPKPGEILKILCTSKGVMNDMLLSKKFFKLHEKIIIDNHNSELFQKNFIEKIGGNNSLLQKSIFIELTVSNGGVIQCLAIPSPGSPFRRLTNFGFAGGNLDLYLTSYLSEAFKWFN